MRVFACGYWCGPWSHTSDDLIATGEVCICRWKKFIRSEEERQCTNKPFPLETRHTDQRAAFLRRRLTGVVRVWSRIVRLDPNSLAVALQFDFTGTRGHTRNPGLSQSHHRARSGVWLLQQEATRLFVFHCRLSFRRTFLPFLLFGRATTAAAELYAATAGWEGAQHTQGDPDGRQFRLNSWKSKIPDARTLKITQISYDWHSDCNAPQNTYPWPPTTPQRPCCHFDLETQIDLCKLPQREKS